jgi:hypothetical protein
MIHADKITMQSLVGAQLIKSGGRDYHRTEPIPRGAKKGGREPVGHKRPTTLPSLVPAMRAAYAYVYYKALTLISP